MAITDTDDHTGSKRTTDDGEQARDDVILRVSDATVTFDMDRGQSRVLDTVCLDIHRTEILDIVGESGSGKSMFASALLDAVVEPGVLRGDITYYPASGDAVDVLALGKREQKLLRWEEISMVFQGAMSSFNPTLSISGHFRETPQDNRVFRAVPLTPFPGDTERLLTYDRRYDVTSCDTIKTLQTDDELEMIDCHTHTLASDNSTPEKRAERAAQVRRQAEVLGIDKICMIGRKGDTTEECREHNRIVAKYVEEHPDLFYGWARVEPSLGEEAVAEFRRAIQDDGLIGLKHHSAAAKIPCDDPTMDPLVEAAVEMAVPMIVHATHRLPYYLEEHDRPYETLTENVRSLAERFPHLKLISGHIGAGGDWEYRIKHIEDQENVYLDISGTNCEAGMVEMATERLGADRLVYGSDGWFIPCVGKLEGAAISPEEKATIAYKMEELLGPDVPNTLSADELAERREAATERFTAVAEPRKEHIVDTNAFLGAWPFRDFGETADELVELMDRKGVDQALVSSTAAVFYRNTHTGNQELIEAIAGHEERLVPVATINPTYAAWKDDLEECLDEFGMQAVKLLPLYHDYDLDGPAVRELFEYCAARDVPVILVGPLEDRRGRHPRVTFRGHDDIRRDFWSDEQVEGVISLLQECPETDVIVADAWEHAFHIKEEVTESHPSGVRLHNQVRTGETLFVLGDLFMYWPYQGDRIVDQIGTDHLVCGPQLPFKTFESYYKYTEHLPVDDDEKEAVSSGNIRSLIE